MNFETAETSFLVNNITNSNVSSFHSYMVETEGYLSLVQDLVWLVPVGAPVGVAGVSLLRMRNAYHNRQVKALMPHPSVVSELASQIKNLDMEKLEGRLKTFQLFEEAFDGLMRLPTDHFEVAAMEELQRVDLMVGPESGSLPSIFNEILSSSDFDPLQRSIAYTDPLNFDSAVRRFLLLVLIRSLHASIYLRVIALKLALESQFARKTSYQLDFNTFLLVDKTMKEGLCTASRVLLERRKAMVGPIFYENLCETMRYTYTVDPAAFGHDGPNPFREEDLRPNPLIGYIKHGHTIDFCIEKERAYLLGRSLGDLVDYHWFHGSWVFFDGAKNRRYCLLNDVELSLCPDIPFMKTVMDGLLGEIFDRKSASEDLRRDLLIQVDQAFAQEIEPCIGKLDTEIEKVVERIRAVILEVGGMGSGEDLLERGRQQSGKK